MPDEFVIPMLNFDDENDDRSLDNADISKQITSLIPQNDLPHDLQNETQSQYIYNRPDINNLNSYQNNNFK